MEIDGATAAPKAAAVLLPSADDRVPWIEKHRPKSLEDVAAHRDIVDTIQRLARENRLPHLLFYGPPGTGKTSTILALARQLYGPVMHNMTLELNASDDRGIGVVRQEVQDFASTKSVFSTKFKLIILDECDAMTKDAQAALRRVMEKYTRNTRFCLICNYVSKIIPALQSRCTRFRFAPLEPKFVEERLTSIAAIEGVKLLPGALQALVALGAGDMRRTLNIFQSAALGYAEVSEGAVYDSTGNPSPADVEQVVDWLLNAPLQDVFADLLKVQRERGFALTDIVRELHPYLFRISGLPMKTRVALVEALADIEWRLASGTSERLQLGALVAAFVVAREDIVAAAV